jgi:anti-sigma regulatory factor (Ser/Thr protein kinase)
VDGVTGATSHELSPADDGRQGTGTGREAARAELKFWAVQAVGWAAAFAAALPLLASGGGWTVPGLAMAAGRELFGLAASGWILRPCLRRWQDAGLSGAALVARAGPLVAVVTGAEVALFFALAAAHGGDELRVHREWATALVLRGALYAGWSGLYGQIRGRMAARARELALARREAAAREAELGLLRAQVNPHFLFNALNLIVAEAEDDPRLARDAALALAEFLRYSLATRAERAPLGEELDALENYLAVEQRRHGARLDCTVEANAAARAALAPTLCVLPLVENALKYGARTRPPPWIIRVEATVDAGGRLRVVVRNTGDWVEPGTAAARGAASTGTGLANLRRRLALLHGGAATVTAGPRDGGVEAVVETPAAGEREGVGG